jgi:ketosteroid isomerase-like protein
MPAGDAEQVRRLYAAINERFAARDLEGLVALYDPEVELLPSTSALVEGGSYRGLDGVRRYFANMLDLYEIYRLELDDVREAVGCVVALGRWHALGRGSGIDLETAIGWVVRLRGERILGVLSFREPADALRAGGLSP